MKTVEIFTDGACSGNPGPGGYGAILRFEGREKEISGGEAQTTNNRMELTAVIVALEALKFPCKVILTTDSKYVVDGIEKGWAKSWRANGWKKKDKKPALNPDLWVTPKTNGATLLPLNFIPKTFFKGFFSQILKKSSNTLDKSTNMVYNSLVIIFYHCQTIMEMFLWNLKFMRTMPQRQE